MTAVEIPEAPVSPQEETLGAHWRAYVTRIRGGDLGSLPAILALIITIIVFGILRPNFFSDRNFANLFQQGAAITLIVRNGTSFVPEGSTRLQAEDKLLVVTTSEARAEAERRLRAISRRGKLAGWYGERGD